MNSVNFSTHEMVDMIWVLGECNKNCLLASKVYRQRFPDRKAPNTRAFEKLMDRFNRTGEVKYEKKDITKTALTEENEMKVLLSIAEDPCTSVRNISQQQDISHGTVQRILKKHKMHPYHIQLFQELVDRDFQRRITFCEWAQFKINRQQNFFDFVLFADEATFHKNGCVNRHNFHYYATSNPNVVSTHNSQWRWSLNVWGGIVGEHVIGPYFFDERVTGAVYLNFLQNHLPVLLEEVPLNIRRQMWYLHDGAPVHNTAPIRDHLNTKFENRWIGRGGPTDWPARSPDLTKVDFFFWGFIKNEVYKTPPTTRDDMKERIRAAFQSVTVNMLRNVSQSFERRLQHCIDNNGEHFEHLV